MLNYLLPNYHPDMEKVTDRSDMDAPLWMYIKDAIKEIEIINMIGRWSFKTEEGRFKGIDGCPEIHVTNFKWNPHPKSEELVFKRRETSDKIATKSIYDLDYYSTISGEVYINDNFIDNDRAKCAKV